MRWTDIHCHLPDEIDAAAQVVASAKEAGVTRLIDVGTSVGHSIQCLRRAKEFDGVWHIYEEPLSSFRARELDERHLKVEMTSTKVEKKITKAVDDMYSKQGIEYKKRLMIQGIDL